MNIFFDNLFGKKSKTKGEVEIVTSSENKDIDTQSGKAEKWSVAYIEDLTSPIVAGSNYLTLFSTIPEVFFPIDYIASRIAGANFQLKKTKDDSVVWANRRMNGILSRPNCLMRWKELIYQHHIYKLCTGNSFIRAAMPDVFSTAEKWRYCDNYWVLPSDKTIVEPVYGICHCLALPKQKILFVAIVWSMVGMVVWKFLHTKYGMIETEMQSSIQGLCS